MEGKYFLDYFNQPIHEGTKVLATLSNRLKICSVVKLNRMTIVVKDLEFKNGADTRVLPENTVVVSGEDLSALALRKGLKL